MEARLDVLLSTEYGVLAIGRWGGCDIDIRRYQP